MQEPDRLLLGKPTHELDVSPSLEISNEDLTARGEYILEHPASLGSLAVAAQELSKPPETDAHTEESERKMRTTENLRVLQKRYGEKFVKGEVTEGGGYAGSAARELLAGFMDKPGFASELKRIIPVRHGALQLLKDNHAYIQAVLEERYKDSLSHERAPAQDPYELARSVGYELTGPFQSASEFVLLDKQDFRQGERLCTFNDPAGRLKDYNILWIRSAEAADTLPADQLTVDKLSDAWKKYLKTIGRYDQITKTYDLSGLRPTRDDPYGTSSMSVQVSRKGTHVSIKNRYNHTVANPDNTLDSDLDNVVYGLKHAVYNCIGRDDLMDEVDVVLAEGYIADNQGGIHHYNYEEENTYYGDYEYITNGFVTTVDRGMYFMISPQLYVPKSGNGDEIRLGQRIYIYTDFYVCNDVKFLHSSSFNYRETDSHIDQLRRDYAILDHEELKTPIIEHIRKQVITAHSAYTKVSEHLAHTPQTLRNFKQLFTAKDQEWQQNGVYDYLVEKLITEGSMYTLVATPNVEASEAQVISLAEVFGEDYISLTYVDDFYGKGYFGGKVPNGSEFDAPIRLTLIPSGYDTEMGYGTVDSHVERLREIQAKLPELNIDVPTMLDAVTYWYNLRAQGDRLNDTSTFDKTYIRYFDLRPIMIDAGLPFVPAFFVDHDGPELASSFVNSESNARLAVG